METAARLARDRARVVDIGKTKLDLPWNAYYDKELDVRFSRSYGPGRYDERYELEGIDYPIGYVRWTERRNLECFLDLIARKEIEVETLVSGVFPLENASTVYADLSSGSLKAVGVLLEYPAPPAADSPPRAAGSSWSGPAPGRAPRGNGRRAAGDRVHRRRQLRLVDAAAAPRPDGRRPTSPMSRRTGRCPRSTRSGASASPRRRPAPTPCFEDSALDAIFIVTRHHSHADLVCRALETGKAVFVEKPLALTRDEVDRVVEAIASTGNDRLMVGFNRRFAPLLAQMKSQFGPPSSNSVTRYLVNAGPLAADSWYRNDALEGSRFIGEGGHFIDTLSWWAGSLPEEVYAVKGPEKDDVQVTVRFQNGSSGAITYVTRRQLRATRRRRSTPRPAAAARGWTTSGRRRSGPGDGRAPCGPGAARTRASRPS